MTKERRMREEGIRRSTTTRDVRESRKQHIRIRNRIIITITEDLLPPSEIMREADGRFLRHPGASDLSEGIPRHRLREDPLHMREDPLHMTGTHISRQITTAPWNHRDIRSM